VMPSSPVHYAPAAPRECQMSSATLGAIGTEARTLE
jgi:hypothetical protein